MPSDSKHSSPVVSLVKAPYLTNAYALSTLITPPLGLAYIAGSLKANEIGCEIIDAVGEDIDQISPLDYCEGYSIGLTMEQIVERISDNADMIGLSSMFTNGWPYDAGLAALIRKRFPDASIVVGGEHASACADYILNTCPEVDVCVHGEGEETIVELLRCVRSKDSLDDVAGITFRKNGKPHTNPRRNRIADIDAIALPDWRSVPLEKYMSRGIGHGSFNARNMPLLATRGCPFQCTFCSSPRMWTTKWSARTPSMVIDEMEGYIAAYNVENFDLYDLTAIIKKSWIIEFARGIIDRGLSITYQLPSGTRSEAIDEEVVDLLYESGCRNFNYAPESGSPRTLEAVKKKVKLPRLLKSLKFAAKRGMSVMVNIILFPDDTPSDVLKTFKFMIRCAWAGADDITFVPFVPYPGGELYDRLVGEGRLPPMSDEFATGLLTHSDISSVKSCNPHFSERQVHYIRLLFLAMFYSLSFLFRPSRVVKTLRNLWMKKPATRGEKTFLMLVRRLRGIRSYRNLDQGRRGTLKI